MGRKGDFSEKGTNPQSFELPKAEIEPGRVTRDAKILYNSNMRQLMGAAQDFLADGKRDITGGLGHLDDSDIKNTISRQALKGVQAQIDSAWHQIEIEEKIGAGDPVRREARKYALVMMQNMTNKYYKNSYGKKR